MRNLSRWLLNHEIHEGFSLESFPLFIIMACICKVIHGMGNIGRPNFDSNQDYLSGFHLGGGAGGVTRPPWKLAAPP